MYWFGIIDSDETPRQLTYHVPDYFNGTLRTMAVAVAADAVGSTSQSSEVRGYFVINPNVPTFVAPGDDFDVTASIANNVEGSGVNATVAVEFKSTPQVEIIGDNKQNLVIPEGQERSVHFKVRATAQLGSADMTFIASLSDISSGVKSSNMSSTLSVRPAIPFSTNINSGYTTDATLSLTLKRSLYPEYRNVVAAVSTSPLILLTGIQKFLNDYPFGCVEQLVSKAFPWLAMDNQQWLTSDKQSISDNIQKTIQMLSQRQMSSGGFNYWPEMEQHLAMILPLSMPCIF